ncbi:response regulator [Marinicella sp. W31]|uniref:hybrid sensor histidine kinase/response regulator transcription factor n=1 Tax=Marinicella sp. W31 TaxID=3023713 RepID=UPI0037574664
MCSKILSILLSSFIVLSIAFPIEASIRFNHLSQYDSGDDIQVARHINQDQNGLIWIGTGYDGLYRYDGHHIDHFPLDFGTLPAAITDLHQDAQKTLWMTTSNKGVFVLQQDTLVAIPFSDEQNQSATWIDMDSSPQQGYWLVSENHILEIDEQGQPIQTIETHLNDATISMIKIFDSEIYVGTTSGLFILNQATQQLLPWPSAQRHLTAPIHDMIQDHMDDFWLATKDGLFQITAETEKINPVINENILSLNIYDNNLWAGSLHEGLYNLNLDTGIIKNYRSHKADQASLNDDNVLSTFIDRDNNLWLGTFNNSVSFVNLDALNFGLLRSVPDALHCSASDVILGIYAETNDWWLATEKGVIKYNPNTNTCSQIRHILGDPNGLSHDFTYSITRHNEHELWISTARGLNKLDTDTYRIDQLNQATPRTNTYFTVNYDTSNAILGTNQGLYLFNYQNNTSQLLDSTVADMNKTRFYNYHINKQGLWYFVSTQGLFALDQNLTLRPVKKVNQQLPHPELVSIFVDEDNHMWLGTSNHGLYQFDARGQLKTRFTDLLGISEKATIYSILKADSDLWLGSDDGLLRLNLQTNTAQRYQYSDGLQNNFFNISSAFKSPDGRLFFGGRGGLNAFYPETIKPVEEQYQVQITEFKLFNKSIKPGQPHRGFSIPQPINELNTLTLSHRELVIEFEFNVTEYNAPGKIQYAYQLEGFNDDWSYVDASNRHANYTNLPANDYVFKVKATANINNWDQPVKSIKITVLPAPWLSWWAITSYVLLLFSILAWVIYRKISADAKLAKMLRTEVNEKTRELHTQKLTVEALLAKKNELFSLVSHEFRTPLTLILGPINELIQKKNSAATTQTLRLVNKNANRLLSLVEQLLQIAKVSSFDKVQFHQQNTAEPVRSIVEAFQHVADKKGIDLQLLHNENALISVTDQCLDAILGNLISNAIKYSPEKSQVSVSARLHHNTFELSVADHGPGLTKQQQSDVFKIFKRLEKHTDVDGVGIGLAVVHEMVKINNGSIAIKSEINRGSQFIIQLPLMVSSTAEDKKTYTQSTLVQQLSHEPEVDEAATNDDASQNPLVTAKDTLLIIEDNQDMRHFIVNTLKEQYHCIEAENGQIGIDQAIEYIPDMIICDVMMPIMDGFDVSRTIRSDEKTSHIPLLLLTALDDKTSRIKGWKENIDSYMTKPFDQEELLIRVDNILSVRNILKKKASFLIDQGKTNQIKLAKKDQDFVDKLNAIIKKNYSDPMLNRSKIAQQMAVSDRQLQRKLKSLIDQNPMDYLRAYRLNQAKILLLEGRQASQVSDDCGFNSLSYFSYSFKAQFGVSPSQYQNQTET